MATLKLSDIDKLVEESDSADGSIHAEMRSNVLLYAGEHYTRRNTAFLNRIRDNQTVGKDQKIRLTKNHVQKIMKLYINNVMSYSPGAIAVPENDKEIDSIKAAELHQSVLLHGKKKYDFKRRLRQSCEDFFTLGEVGTLIRWDPNKGDFLGYKQALNDAGEPQFDENGAPAASEDAVFSGDFTFSRIFGFNLIRPKEAQSFDEARFIGYKEMADIEDLKKQYADQPEKLKFLQADSKTTMMLFYGQEGSYRQSDKEVMLRNIYIKPCMEYPNGWYSISTNSGILEEDELPFGIFPIVYETCEEFQTTPRGRSPIKHARPFQAEINRAASKIAEHQITLGDDKLILINGSKATPGAQLPGIRTFNVTGQAPVVMQGRAGEQFYQYIDAQIKEMYSAMLLPEALEEKEDPQADPYSLLFKSLRQRKKFSMYVDKFEAFTTKFYALFLELARHYYDESTVIQMVGKREQVNISEFQNSSPLGYKIEVEPASDDVDTLMGRQLVMNHMLQYVGNQLSRDDIGKILKNMPLANTGEIFNDLTLDYENATNDILALDRGQQPFTGGGTDPAYTLKRIESRMKQADFQFMDPGIQQNYSIYRQQLQDLIVVNQQQIKAMNADMIPAQGFLIPVDFYVQDPANPAKTRRARLPMDSVAWLVQRLEQQGSSLEQMDTLQPDAQAGVAARAQATMAGAQIQGQTSEQMASRAQGAQNEYGNNGSSPGNSTPGDHPAQY